MELSKRIEKLVEYSGLSIPKFAERVGFKTPQGVRELLKGNTRTLSEQAQYKILHSFPEINPSWLLTGIGEMLLNESPPIEPPPESGDTILIPVVNLDSRGGMAFNEEVQTDTHHWQAAVPYLHRSSGRCGHTHLWGQHGADLQKRVNGSHP